MTDPSKLTTLDLIDALLRTNVSTPLVLVSNLIEQIRKLAADDAAALESLRAEVETLRKSLGLHEHTVQRLATEKVSLLVEVESIGAAWSDVATILEPTQGESLYIAARRLRADVERLKARQVATPTDGSAEYQECASCAAKPGAPDLCAACLHNRTLVARLKAGWSETGPALLITHLRAEVEARKKERDYWRNGALHGAAKGDMWTLEVKDDATATILDRALAAEAHVKEVEKERDTLRAMLAQMDEASESEITGLKQERTDEHRRADAAEARVKEVETDLDGWRDAYLRLDVTRCAWVASTRAAEARQRVLEDRLKHAHGENRDCHDANENEDTLAGELLAMEARARVLGEALRKIRNLILAAVAYQPGRTITAVDYLHAADKLADAALAQSPQSAPPDDPLGVLLFCPSCKEQHVDKPEPESGWTNPPHKSHKCHFCNVVWRASDGPTNGIAAPTTRGKDDTWDVFDPQSALDSSRAESGEGPQASAADNPAASAAVEPTHNFAEPTVGDLLAQLHKARPQPSVAAPRAESPAAATSTVAPVAAAPALKPVLPLDDRCPACGHGDLSMDRLGEACPLVPGPDGSGGCPDPTAWLRSRKPVLPLGHEFVAADAPMLPPGHEYVDGDSCYAMIIDRYCGRRRAEHEPK